jgi:hypothetical protein
VETLASPGRPRKVKLAGECGNYAPEKKRVQGKSKIILIFHLKMKYKVVYTLSRGKPRPDNLRGVSPFSALNFPMPPESSEAFLFLDCPSEYQVDVTLPNGKGREFGPSALSAEVLR